MFRITNIFKNSQKIILNSQKRKFLNYFSPSTTTNSPKKLSLPPLKDESLRNEILIHPSAPLNNHHLYRRYCFYGDKAYNYFIARELYNKLPDVSNAELTTITHQLVSRNFLAEIAIECGLDKLIKVTKNSPVSTGILCENVEAHFAIYILSDMEEEMKKFVADIVNSRKNILKSQKQNFLNFFSPSTTTNLPKKLSLPPLKDESLRNEILTHPSASLNSHHIYRRYCFYGDKAYDYFIARELYNKLPDASNAELTTTTHQLVSRNFLAEVAIECGLDKLIKVAKNSSISTGILCENIIVHFAVYILNGMEEEMKKFAADVVDFYFDKEKKE